MHDLATQIREYFDAYSEPVDIEAILKRPADHDPITRQRSEPMTIDLEPAPTPVAPMRHRRRSVASALAAAAALVGLVFALVLVTRSGDDEPVQPVATPTISDTEGALSPADVLDLYENAVNARDIDAVMLLYADDAVVTGHPTGPDVATGQDEIRRAENASMMQMADREGQVFWLTQREIDGDVAVAGHVWYSPTGCFSGTGDRVVIEDGLITEWARGTNSGPCVRDLLDDLLVAAETLSPNRLVTALDSDVVLSGHSAAGTDPLVGRVAVEELLLGEFSSIGADVVPELANVEWDGPVASFDLVFRAPSKCIAIVGSQVVAEGGKIVRWAWGAENPDCAATD